MEIEAFRKKLIRTEVLMSRSLQTAGGEKLIKKLNDMERIQRMRRRIDDFVKPSRAGFGMIGEATLRATRGGTLDPSSLLQK